MTVWPVPLGMIVLNVMAPTVLSTVIFVPKLMAFNHKTEAQLNLPLLQPSPSLAQQLPTTVHNRRRLPFLSGYDSSIVQLLVSGFTSCFSLHFSKRRPVSLAIVSLSF